jgi:NAD(P)H-dependent FMN reductase
MGAHLAGGGRKIKALDWLTRPQFRALPATAAAAEFYSAAALTAEQNMNIIVPQAAMDQIPGCIVQLWIKKGISL